MIKDQLNTLKTNIENTKDKLYTNLSNKGVTTITTASTLSEMADSVNNITVGGSSEGGNSFEPLGYAVPKYIQDGIDYGKTIKDNWDASVTSRSQAFSGDKQLMFFPNVDTSNVTYMISMFSNCTSLQYVPPMDTSNVINMDGMFKGCNSLTSLDTSNWDTSNVTNMMGMFRNCSSLTSLDLSGWDTSNVTKMSSMFDYCSSLTTLDLSSFDTSNINNMQSMFSFCSGLTTLDLSSFDTSNVTSMGNMFSNCKSLTTLDLSSFDTSNVNYWSSTFDCASLEQIKGTISLRSYSSATMSYYTIFSFSNIPLYEVTVKDIGYHSNAKQFNSQKAISWGVENDKYPNARQSLIDSLITYSFDRATAGYATCTITISANSKAVLTNDEIAAITAKGFTIA